MTTRTRWVAAAALLLAGALGIGNAVAGECAGSNPARKQPYFGDLLLCSTSRFRSTGGSSSIRRSPGSA